MPALEYQPLELPASAAKTYDFLVLGSGIAGLTYALKVNSQLLHPCMHTSNSSSVQVGLGQGDS